MVAQTHTPDFFDHPIFDFQSFHLETRAMRAMKEQIQRWLWTGHTGGVILGDPRIGKTHAVAHLLSDLTLRNGQRVPAYYISIPRRDTKTIKAIMRLLCLDRQLLATGPTEYLSSRFVNYLFEYCHTQHARQLLIVVDEMQRLAPRQLEAFAEIFDDLQMLGVRATVVFVGNQRESNEMLNHLPYEEYDHIYGRFLEQRGHYVGLKSEEDVRFCLGQYDTLRYPKQGPSYVRYFVPPSTPESFRFASLSPLVWQTFRAAQKKYGFTSWGMQYFVCAMNTLLTDYFSKEGAIEECDASMLNECIAVSGLISSHVRTPGDA